MRVLSILVTGGEGPWGESLGRAKALWGALRERGHEVHVLADAQTHLYLEAAGSSFTQDQIHRVPGPSRGAMAWAQGAWFGQRVARDIRPDVIMAHDIHSAVFARKCRRAAPYARFLIDLPVLDEDNQRLVTDGLTRWLAGPAIREADEVITVSSAMRRLVGEVRTKSSVHVIPDGVDVNQFRPREQSGDSMGMDTNSLRHRISPGAEYVVAFQCDLEPKNDPLLLVSAARSVCAEHPRTAFWVMGDGSKEAEMRRSVVRNGLSEKFVFNGSLPHHLLSAYIRESDLGVVLLPDGPSSFGRLTPSAFKFWAAGKPVVFPDSPALSEVTARSRIGATYSAGDAYSLAKSISGLLSDAAGRRAMSEEARALMVAKFRWEVLGASMADVVDRPADAISAVGSGGSMVPSRMSQK